MPFFFILSLRQVGHLICRVICISLSYQILTCLSFSILYKNRACVTSSLKNQHALFLQCLPLETMTRGNMNLLIIGLMVTPFLLMTTAPRSTQEVEQISVQKYQKTSQSIEQDSEV